MDVESPFPADREAAELVEQGQGLLDDVPELAESLDAGGPAAGDDGPGPACAAGLAEGVAVVSLVGQDCVEPVSRPAASARDRGYGVEQRDGLGDVVDVPTRGDHRQR